MRPIIILAFGLFLLCGCNRNVAQSKPNTEDASLTPYQDYKPNPDEVVISAKLVSFEDGTAKVEVVEQLSTGFGAKMVLNPGQKLSLSTGKKPADKFICALASSESLGGKKTYRITRFLK